MANDEVGSAEDRFGRNVRRLREQAGLKQADLAAKVTEQGLKMHPSAVAKIELRDVASPRSIRLNEAQAIARALDVPLAELLGGATEEERIERAFIELLRRLQRSREQVGVSADEWLDAKSALGSYLKVIEDFGVERLDAGFQALVKVTEAKGLLRETVQEAVDAYMEPRHGVDQEA